MILEKTDIAIFFFPATYIAIFSRNLTLYMEWIILGFMSGFHVNTTLGFDKTRCWVLTSTRQLSWVELYSEFCCQPNFVFCLQADFGFCRQPHVRFCRQPNFWFCHQPDVGFWCHPNLHFQPKFHVLLTRNVGCELICLTWHCTSCDVTIAMSMLKWYIVQSY